MIVDEKVDSWALGVIAYELLMERSAFGMFQGVNDVRSKSLYFKQLFGTSLGSAGYLCWGHKLRYAVSQDEHC
jgi:hypothetical protein